MGRNMLRGILRLLVAGVLLGVEPTSTIASTDAEPGDRVFTEVEKTIIRRYFGEGAHSGAPRNRPGNRDGRDAKSHGPGKKKNLPPGLAKRRDLPPGLAGRETLPPGLAKRELPPDLVSQLPQRRRHTERVIVDNSVILIERATGKMLDILEDVITSR